MTITDRDVAVLGAEGALGSAIVAALTASGLRAVGVDESELDSGTAFADTMRAAAPGGLSAVIDAGFVGAPPLTGDLAALSSDAWLETAEQPMRRALHVLQGAHLCLRDAGGRIVVLLPSVVMSGGAGVVGWAAAAEGYRSLIKAAARAWGMEGITIKCVLVPAGLTTDSVVDRPGLQPPALGREADLQADIAPAVAALLDERLDSVTGLTLAVDGGVWMTS